MTSVIDGREHLVDERVDGVTRAGEYPAICGRTILPAALTTPPGPGCPRCHAPTARPGAVEASDTSPMTTPLAICDQARPDAQEPRMSGHFEIQARLLKRRAGIVVRDDVRRARADTIDDAVTAARSFTADGFTVWIYRVKTGSGVCPTYQRVQMMNPDR